MNDYWPWGRSYSHYPYQHSYPGQAKHNVTNKHHEARKARSVARKRKAK